MQTLWLLALLALLPEVTRGHGVKGHMKVKVAHEHCFSEQELAESARKVAEQYVGHRMDWERYSSVQLVGVLESVEKRRKRRRRTTDTSCPTYDTISQGTGMSERSISPWTYRIDVDENRYPAKLAFAKCLCKHCISTYSGQEDGALDSMPITQNMLVLTKEVCPRDKSKFTFRVGYLPVPVACTCTVPNYS